MLLNENDLINLVKDTYRNIIVEHNRFGNLIVRINKRIWCEFYFKTFPLNIREDKTASVHEDFIGHTCLSFGWFCADSGGGYMEVADKKDLSSKVIDYLPHHAKTTFYRRRKT